MFFLDESLAAYRHHSSNATGWIRRRRGLTGSVRAARNRFGYHLLMRLLVSRGLIDVMYGLVADHSELALLPSTHRLLEMLSYWAVFEERYAARYRIIERDRPDLRLRALTGLLRSTPIEGPWTAHSTTGC